MAEECGYSRALVYDSPAFLADPWITLAHALAPGRATGVEGVLYGPMGPDIARELHAFADAAQL